jgi:hypothetical protein
VNKADAKMMSANFKDGELQRVYYFEQAKNDGYPVVQLSRDERLLKGFKWQEDRRPADRNAVTPLSLRPSQRSFYSARPRAKFRQTNIYFPGYMSDINRQIAVRDSLRRVREREAAIAKREAAAKARRDSIALADSMALKDSLFHLDSIAKADSLKSVDEDMLKAASDSLKAVNDSISVGKVKTKEEIKAAKMAEREAARKKRKEEKEKRWAELDNKDELKAKKKEEKRLAKLRKKKRKALEDRARQEARDADVLEKYRQKFEQHKQKEEAKTKPQS